MGNPRPRVLLVYPGRKSMGFTYPMGLLYIAKSLSEMGIDVTLHHMGIEPFGNVKLERYLFVGISLLTGEIISNGLRVAKLVKSCDRDIPVIAGGVHPSLLPGETLANELIDYVVVGEGDETIKEIAARLLDGRSLTDVEGLAYRNESGRTVINPQREYIAMDSLGFDVPYHLLGEHFRTQNFIPVHTSRGCPFRCGFCYNPVVHKRRYRYKSAERVVEEIEYLHDKYGIKGFGFDFEDEFFVNPARAYRIFQAIIEKGLDIRWTAFCRFDSFIKGYDRFGDDFIDVLKRSGCHYISFGAESGSQRVLDEVIRKDIKVSQVLRSVEILKKGGIPHRVSFICCFPTETAEDLEMTLNLIEDVSKDNPYIIIGLFKLIPLPGTAIFDRLVTEYGFHAPGSLVKWGEYRMPDNSVENVTWVERTHAVRCARLSLLSNYPFYKDFYSYGDYKEFVLSIDSTYGIGYLDYILARVQRWRYKNRFFHFMVEAPVFDRFTNLRMFLVRYVLKKYLPESLYTALKKRFGKNLWAKERGKNGHGVASGEATDA